ALLSETAPYRLLEAALQFAGSRRYDDLAAILRHPDLEDWLQDAPADSGTTQVAGKSAETKSSPAQLDRYFNAHLPNRVTLADLEFHNSSAWPDLKSALGQIEEWLKEASGNYPLRAWGKIFRNVLSAVYGSRLLNLDDGSDELLHEAILRILEAYDLL